MDIYDEVKKCLLCHDATCSKACGKYDPASFVRSCYFDNYFKSYKDAQNIDCINCDKDCENACINNVKITSVIDRFKYMDKDDYDYDKSFKVDLSSDVCGIKIENPFLLSSSVVSSNYEMISKAFDMGWAGVAFKTISLIEINEASPRFSANKSSNSYFYGFKNIEQLSDHSLEENMLVFKKLKENYPSKIIIASIMGRNEDEWKYLATKVSEAGADAIELNFSCPNMEEKNTGLDVGQDPELCYKYTKAVKDVVNIPVLAKMTPNITDMRVPAIACVKAGVDGIAAINTIKSITGVDVITKVVQPTVGSKSIIGGYSGAAIKPIALRFISEMANDQHFKNIHFSGMGGIETWYDSVQYIMLGCSSLQITTAVMQFGYRIIDDLLDGLKSYMAKFSYHNINEFKGAALKSIVNNDELDRSSIVYPVINYDLCIGCGRCYVSCYDGGHQAISYDSNTRKVTFNLKKCVGCLLCSIICPRNAIDRSKRIINVNKSLK